MRKIKAVITADIVNSSLLGKKALNSLIKSLGKLFNALNIIYDFYRGDSFHAVCDVSIALKASCVIRTLAIQYSEKEGEAGIDIRMAIGIGKIEEPLGDLGTAKGEAFILSGREMDKLEKTGPRLSIRCMDAMADMGLSAIGLFTDYVLNKMTIKQAEVIHQLLLGATQVEVANKLHKTQSTVNKHAGAANWNELSRMIDVYTNIAGLLVNQNK